MSLTPPSVAPARRSVPIALFAVALLVVAGGAVAGTAAYLELRPAPAPPGATHVIDDLGRSVAVPPHPSRVVVLGTSIVDSMVRLGLRGEIVGVDCGTPAAGGLTQDYNASQIAAWSLTQSLCIETSPAVNGAQILNATPDLVLATTLVSLSDIEEISVTDGLPVVVLQPSTLGGIVVDVQLLGEIFGAAGAAQGLVDQLQQVLGTVQQVVTNLSFTSALPSVLLTYYASPSGSPDPGYWTYGPGTFGESLIEFVGASSISANSSIPYFALSGDQVLASDPWGIVYGTGFGVTLSTYQQGPQWSSLPAVTAGRAWGIDSNLITEPDPTMVLTGLPILLDLVHPGSYPAT